ncbi:6-phosphogluconolactonase [Marinilongibacter aquaticus]|uniref:6-phosphogluconolactonase n=1 Tax=Marinilongibacter aquaticus TaxID=2975157 RepID=UPI0021BDCBEE|nr:6-phosphogluconolactonase [Marinilongibacter aquaticus]UBM58355.1 6-phosphogluconolactonase [Marinilongibacter aquaticus]
MEKHIKKEQSELLVDYANFLIETGNKSIAENGRFNLVLSGGSSPKALFTLLTRDEYREQLDWQKVYFFFGDERYVPAEDADYNGLMAQNYLFEPLGIAAPQIFLVNTALAPEACAADYEKRIGEHFGEAQWRFDFMMLGMGGDAHTASLFPGTSILPVQEVGVRAVLIKPEVWRISMTAALINQSKEVAFLTFGESKAEALHHVWEGEYNPNMYPSQLIKPLDGHLHWFVDEAAAASMP